MRRTSFQEEKRWITDIIAHGLPAGDRNNSTARFAGYFASRYVPEDIIYELVRKIGWEEHTHPFTDEELRTVVRSICTREMQKQVQLQFTYHLFCILFEHFRFFSGVERGTKSRHYSPLGPIFRQMPPGALKVYMLMTSYRTRYGQNFSLSESAIGKETNLTRYAVRRALRDLTESRLVERTFRGFRVRAKGLASRWALIPTEVAAMKPLRAG